MAEPAVMAVMAVMAEMATMAVLARALPTSSSAKLRGGQP